MWQKYEQHCVLLVDHRYQYYSWCCSVSEDGAVCLCPFQLIFSFSYSCWIHHVGTCINLSLLVNFFLYKYYLTLIQTYHSSRLVSGFEPLIPDYSSETLQIHTLWIWLCLATEQVDVVNRAPVSQSKIVSEPHRKQVPKSVAGDQFVFALSVLIAWTEDFH